MAKLQTFTREEAQAGLRQWLKDMPGGEYLPENVLALEPFEVGVNIESRDRYFIRLFEAAFEPTGEECECCEYPLYKVPPIISHILQWYADEFDWSVCN